MSCNPPGTRVLQAILNSSPSSYGRIKNDTNPTGFFLLGLKMGKFTFVLYWCIFEGLSNSELQLPSKEGIPPP